MSKDRPAWMVPCQYNDDRFTEPTPSPAPKGWSEIEPDVRDADDVNELMNRPEQAEKEYECKDTTPINYNMGPHDESLGVDESQFDHPDDEPVPYENGPNDDELGIDEDDEE
jgi:hypothetical protein